MDFMADELFDGPRIWVSTVVDHFSHESLAFEVGQKFRGHDVTRVPTRIGSQRGLTKTIRIRTDFRQAHVLGICFDLAVDMDGEPQRRDNCTEFRPSDFLPMSETRDACAISLVVGPNVVARSIPGGIHHGSSLDGVCEAAG